MNTFKIIVEFVPDAADGFPWRAKVAGWAFWCQSDTPMSAVEGIMTELAEHPNNPGMTQRDGMEQMLSNDKYEAAELPRYS